MAGRPRWSPTSGSSEPASGQPACPSASAADAEAGWAAYGSGDVPAARASFERALGVQQVTSDGDAAASIRSNARAGYRVDTLREVSLSLGYSSAGLSNFATGSDGYRYVSVVLGVDWVF